MIAVVLCVALPIIALAICDWERAHRPRQVVQRDPRPAVRVIPVEDRPRSLAQDAYDSIAGGTELEARVFKARRMMQSHRTFGDAALRRTR